MDTVVDSVTDEVLSLTCITRLSKLGHVNTNQLNWSEWCSKLLLLLRHLDGLLLTLNRSCSRHGHWHLLHVLLVGATLVLDSTASSTVLIVTTSLLIHEVVCALVHLIHWSLLSASAKGLPLEYLNKLKYILFVSLLSLLL